MLINENFISYYIPNIDRFNFKEKIILSEIIYKRQMCWKNVPDEIMQELEKMHLYFHAEQRRKLN